MTRRTQTMTLHQVQSETREQRRYEIARDVMARVCSQPPGKYGIDIKEAAADAVQCADALLDALADVQEVARG